MSDSPEQQKTVRTQFHTFGSEDQPFTLGSRETLSSVTLAYETYGEMNAAKDNVILLFHAMTGSQHAAGYNPSIPEIGSRWTEECHFGWWDAFIGSQRALNTDKFCVICVNYLGGCYGSTGPASINPTTGKPYGAAFPRIGMGDIVASQLRLLDHLGVEKLHAAVGASIGGMLCLSFATLHPERVKRVIPIGTGLLVTPLQRLLNFEQAFAIEFDANFNGGDYYDGPAPEQGLAHARMIAHKTFVSLKTLTRRANEKLVNPHSKLSSYEINSPLESYMLHQGRKFVQRFDANSYLRILECWQHFDLLRQAGQDSLVALFERCREQDYLAFSIDSDVSFYPEEQEHMIGVLKTAGVRNMRLTVHSEKGHDSFLLEPELYTPHLVYSLEGRP